MYFHHLSPGVAHRINSAANLSPPLLPSSHNVGEEAFNSTNICAIFTRAITITTADYKLIACSRCCNSLILDSHFLISHHLSTSRFLGKPFQSTGGLVFPNLTRNSNARLFARNEIFSARNQRPPRNTINAGIVAPRLKIRRPFLCCPVCRSVQPVNESIDYFQIYGLGREYKVEVEELEKKYKDWQKKLHPDLVHSKSQREREYAAEQSSRVIDAYRTLTDPLSRAIYMVKLEGVLVDEEERITDPELLSEIMELREAVDEADDTQSLNVIQAQLQEKLQCWSNAFGDAYLNKNYEDALASIRRMTYYRRANEEIVKKV